MNGFAWGRLGLAMAVAVGSLSLAACAGGGSPMQSAAAIGEPTITPPEYHLGAGDKIRLITFNEPSLTGEFDVSSSGTVPLPLIGEVKAVGLTPTQLQDAVTAVLKQGYLKDPRVSVQVLTYRPFYIMGEVNKPGEYPYAYGLTVAKAVATANGFTYRADQRRVFIKRPNDTNETEMPLDANTFISPGDTVRIAERYF